jgi:chorismate dehydratase
LPKLRVGIVNYLNSKPLAWGFLKGHHSDLFAPSYHSPAMVADLLARGSLDVGLIPAIEVQRIPGLTVLPDLCVAATHEVRSVLLVLGKPLAQVRRVALDSASRTSAALVRILLADRYRLSPTFVPARADPVAMLSEADAALVIGDPALTVDRRRHPILDLAAEWRAETGHPFVFAVWAVAPGVSLPNLPFYFKSSLRYGLASMDTVVRESAAELGLPSDEVKAYLTRNLCYVLREPELAGLGEFYRRAYRHGLIEAPRELALWAA